MPPARLRCDFDAHTADFFEQLLGEVQSRGRRCRGTFLARIYGLIVAVVFELLCDVGRQGHSADFIENGIEIPSAALVVFKSDNPVSVVRHFVDDALEQTVSESDASALFQPFAGAHNRFPNVERALAQQQTFRVRALGAVLSDFLSVNARRNDLGIVDDEHVSGAQIVRDIAENPVRDSAGFSVEHHESRVVAPLGRMLGDERFRQLKEKIRGFKPCGRQFIFYHKAVSVLRKPFAYQFLY